MADMHTAPAVDYPVGPARWFRRAWTMVWLFALAVSLLWIWQAGPGERGPWLGLIAAFVGALVATHVESVVGSGSLVWDAKAWWWEHGSARTSGLVTLELDLQDLLLLRFVPDSGKQHWFWIERGPDLVRWLALRRAVRATAVLRDANGAGDDQAKALERVTGP